MTPNATLNSRSTGSRRFAKLLAKQNSSEYQTDATTQVHTVHTHEASRTDSLAIFRARSCGLLRFCACVCTLYTLMRTS